MKAVIYTKYGSPGVLQVKVIDKPIPKLDEVLIKVHAAEVTKADCELRSFRFPVKWFWLPLRLVLGVTKPRRQVLGGYFSGEIESVGADVQTFKPGDTIFGSAGLSMGAYAEYLCLQASHTIIPKPVNMSYVQAAVVPLGGLNAIHFLKKANIQAGDQVLINGAGGSIGMFGVQIAKSLGATVTVVDKASKADTLYQLGADHFIDYCKDDFTGMGQRYDVIFNMVAGSSYAGCVRALKPNGRYLMANPRISDMLKSVWTGWFSNKTAIFAFAAEKKEELLVLKTMIEAGEIKSIIDTVYPFEQAIQAHQKVEAEQRCGAVVISAQAN